MVIGIGTLFLLGLAISGLPLHGGSTGDSGDGTETGPMGESLPVRIPPPPGPMAIDKVLADIAGPGADWATAKQRLLSEDDAGLASLRRLVKHSDVLVLQFAIDALGDIGSEEAASLLRGLLDNRNPMIWVPAAISLYRCGDSSGVLLMAYELGHSESAQTREVAALYMGEVGPIVGPVLARALDDRSWEVRYNALGALWNSGAASRVRLSVKLLEDEQWLIRKRALARLADLSGDDLGVDPMESPEGQPGALARWRAWLEQSGYAKPD